MAYTKNIDLARNHLEKAWTLCENLISFDDVRFDTASLLAQLYLKMDQKKLAKAILRKAVELSVNNSYWHCRLLLQLSQIHATDKGTLFILTKHISLSTNLCFFQNTILLPNYSPLAWSLLMSQMQHI